MKPSCRKLFLLLVFLTLSPLAHAQLKDAYKEETTIFHANQQYGLRFTYYEKDGAIGYMELALKKPGDVYRSCGSGFKGVTAESIGTATLAAIDAETLASTIYPERSCIPNEIRDLKEFLIKATRAEQNARKKLGKKISQYDIDAILAEYRPPDITEMSGQQAKTELENAISPEKAGAYWRCYDYNEYKKILESISKLTEANIAATIEHAKKQKETKQTAQKTPAQTQPTTPALKDDKNKETATTAQKKHPPAEAAIAKSAKKAAGKKEEQNEKAVLVYFNIEPKGAETKPKEAEMPESEDFTLKNLVFAKESEWQGFEYSMGFKDNLGVENYDIRASKIASYDLKEIYPVGEREIYNIQPEKKIGKENKGLAVNSHALTEGIWKIMVVAKTKDGKKTVSTYWKPEYSKYLLDGVIAIAPNSYADKRDYELKTEARRCELLYKEKAETVCPLSKKVREKREEVDAHLQKMNEILETDSKGEKIEEFKYNNQQFLRERENLAAESVKLIAAVNGEKSEKAKEFKTRIYNSLWLQKLIYYLGTEKSLVEKKMSLCSNSWLDKSLLTFKESVYASKLEGLESGYGCNKGSEEELTYKLAYLNYILNNLAKYEKDLTEGKTAQTLEEAIANLRVNFPAYLRWETEKADNALENLEKANEKIVVKENGETYVKVSGAMIFTGLKEREFEDGILVKLNKNTCYTIPAMHAESNSDGSNEMSDDVRTINIFCAPYTAKLIAETALKHPYAKNKLQAEGSNVLLTHVKFSDRLMAQDEAMLTRLANEAKKLEQDDAYTELAMLARFSGSSAIIDSSASTKFDFDKCIAPYTTPGFVFTTAAFVGAAMLTGGAGFPALAGAAGDAMMVHGAISLIQSKDAGMTRRLCDFAFISTGVAFGHTSIKIRQQALKLSPEQIPALGKKIKTPEALAKTLGKEVKASELVKAIVESIRVKGETTGVTVKSGANLLKGVRETAKLSKKESGYTVECASACYTGTAGEDYTSTGYYGQTPPEITGKYDFHPGNIKRGSGEYIDIGNIRYGYIYRTSVGNSWFYSLYDAPVFVYTKGKTLFLQKGERAAIPRDAQIQVGTTLIVTHPSWGWRHAKPKLERLGKAVKGIGEPFRWAAEELASFARKITATHPKTAYKLRFANGEEWSVSYGEPIYIGSASNNHLVPNIEFLDAYHGKIIAYEDGHLVYFEGVHAPVTNPSKIIQYINGGWREVGVTAQMIEAPIRLTDGYGVVLADGTAISTEGVWTAEGVKWVEFKPRSSKSTESAKQAEKTTGRAKETSRGKQKSETKRVLARPARSAAQEISFVQETTNVLRSTSNRDGNLIRIDARNAKVVTLGDIHGDYNTLAATLSETRIADRLANGENVFLLFLGDIVDRATSADKQFAVTNTVLELVKTYPDRVVLLRGNHEHLAQTARYGFENDVIQTFGRTGVSEAYQSLFNELPIAALIDNGYSRTLAVHGFIPTREAFAPGADKISQLARASAESPIGKQTLWNDPTTGDTASGNRGSNDFYKISQADTEAFMRENGITYILRAHEEVPGFKDVYGDQRVFNLFSNNEHYTGGGRGYAVLEPQGSVIVGNAGGQRYRYQSEPYEQNWQQRTNGQNEQQSQANEPTNPSTLFTRKWSPTTEQAREYLKTDVPELESNFYKVTEGYISLKPEKAPQKDALKAKIRQLFNKYHPDKAYNDIALKRDYNSIMIELNTLMAALNR